MPTTSGQSSSSPSVPSPAITMPALTNKFILMIDGTPPSFSMQVVAYAINLVKKETIAVIEQSLTNTSREHVVIQDMIDNPGREITLELLDSRGNVVDTIIFNDCKVIDHAFTLDYSTGNPVWHEVSFAYDAVKMSSGAVSQQAYNSAMSVVGKRP